DDAPLKGLVHAARENALQHRALRRLHKAAPVPAAPDYVRAQRLRRARLRLRPAAAHRAHRARAPLRETAQRLARLPPALRRHGAAVHDDDVRALALARGLVAALAQERLHGL